MTKEEIKMLLNDTKVYVNGKSREIQEKLFSFGYGWDFGNNTEVRNTDKPFLFIYKDGDITYLNNMCKFTEHEHREISADKILSLEVTEPSYRPFKNKDECWNEMLKHQPFGWLRHKQDGYYIPIRGDISTSMAFTYWFNEYNFADGTPFGILEN